MYGTNLFYQVWYNVETEARDKYGSEIRCFLLALEETLLFH
jgi:hypothetical protein